MKNKYIKPRALNYEQTRDRVATSYTDRECEMYMFGYNHAIEQMKRYRRAKRAIKARNRQGLTPHQTKTPAYNPFADIIGALKAMQDEIMASETEAVNIKAFQDRLAKEKARHTGEPLTYTENGETTTLKD